MIGSFPWRRESVGASVSSRVPLHPAVLNHRHEERKTFR